MRIIIDEREHDLYNKCYSIIFNEGNCLGIEIIKRVLPLGDILIQTTEEKDVMLIERKSFSDMLASIRDGRYDEQSHRLIHSSGFPFHTIVYVLEGVFSQTSSKEKKLLYSTMASLNYFKGFSVMRTNSVRETAEWVVWTADKIGRDFVKGKIPSYLIKNTISGEYVFCGKTKRPPVVNGTLGGSSPSPFPTPEPVPSMPPLPPTTEDKIENTSASQPIINTLAAAEGGGGDDDDEEENVAVIPAYSSLVKKVKKDNITPQNIGEILLCQIPSVHSVTAVAIMKRLSSFQNLIHELENHPDCLNDIYTETNGKKRKISKAVIQNIREYLIMVQPAAEGRREATK